MVLLLVLRMVATTGASIAETRWDSILTSETCASASSSVQELAKIVNTRDETYQCLGVSVDSREAITGIRFEMHGFDVDPASGKQIARNVRIREFAPAQLASEQGALLDGIPGHDAVMLRGDIDAEKTTASLVVKFLYNGLTDEFRACKAMLVRGQGGDWHLVDTYHRPVSLVVVKTWGLPVIGTIGIEALPGICASGQAAS